MLNIPNTPFDSRDINRSPMQWDETTSAGFSTNAVTWLPVQEKFTEINVNIQKNAERSNYHYFKELISLRKEDTLIYGGFNSKVMAKYVFAFTRELIGSDTLIVVSNYGWFTEVVDLSTFVNLPDKVKVAASASNSQYRIGYLIYLINNFFFIINLCFIFQ